MSKFIVQKLGKCICEKCGEKGIMYVKIVHPGRENLKYVYVAHSVKKTGSKGSYWTSRYCYIGRYTESNSLYKKQLIVQTEIYTMSEIKQKIIDFIKQHGGIVTLDQISRFLEKYRQPKWETLYDPLKELCEEDIVTDELDDEDGTLFFKLKT